jgi:glucose uptake protein
MILPQTYVAALIVLAFALLCQGSWASTYKLARKLRFELYYFDFAFGLVAAALLFAYTLGSLGFDGFSLMDDLMNAGKRQWLFAFISGVVFNLANMLIMAAVAVAGMAIAFPVGLGMALVISTVLAYIAKGSANSGLLFAGCALIVAAIAADALANRQLIILRHEELARAGKAKSTRRPTSAKAVLLALTGGLLMGGISPLLERARHGDLAMGPYSLGLMFAAGAFISTFLLNMFFMNLPAEGEPIDITDYFKVKLRQHAYGFMGGFVWMTGLFAAFVGTGPHAGATAPPVYATAFLAAVPLLAALWGIVVWREFRGADLRARSFLTLMLVLFAFGAVLLSLGATAASPPVTAPI